METAPNGKNRTKVAGAETACAIRVTLKLLVKEPPPPEDELGEPELLPEGDIAAAVFSKGFESATTYSILKVESYVAVGAVHGNRDASAV